LSLGHKDFSEPRHDHSERSNVMTELGEHHLSLLADAHLKASGPRARLAGYDGSASSPVTTWSS
jgi:hypothetical protein